MNYEAFVSNYLRVITTNTNDAIFGALQVTTGGLSTPRTGALLNMAASCMDDGERYVETGVFTGYTLISAGYGNRKLVLGIDKFDTDGMESSVGTGIDAAYIKNRLLSNIDRFKHSVRATVIQSDFRTVDISDFKTGVTFIDARHDYENVMDNLAWIAPSLVKDAVLIFDDPDLPGVAEAILDWVHDEKGYELLYLQKQRDMFHRTPSYDSTFSNGLAIVHFNGL